MESLHSSVIARRVGDPAVEPDPDQQALVEDLLRTLSTALRNHRLYSGQQSMLDRFVTAARNKLGEIWATLPVLRLRIDEQCILWEEEPVYPTGGDSGDLAFLFFKDGIRVLTLLPGFEEEIEAFLEVLARAPTLRNEEDDLVTLLWQADLAKLRYDHVELTAEEVELSVGQLGSSQPVNVAAVRADVQQPTPGLTPDDFRETLYFLDESELRRLADEVRREGERDLWAGVTTALYDRLEDGTPERKRRILRILSELLAYAMGSGQFGRTAGILRELVALAGRAGAFTPDVLRDVRSLFDQLSRGDGISQLAMTLEDNPDALRSGELPELLGFLPPLALAPLMRAAAAVSRPDVRRLFEHAIERLATLHREEVVRLLGDDDPGVVVEAVRWAGRLGIGSTVPELQRMLWRPETPVRLAALDALQALRAGSAGRALVELLEDPERDVRLAAVKALSALEFTGARPALEAAITSKRLRVADRTEKLAYFEAFGHLAGAEGVALLDRTLNGRSWLGKGEGTEIRACAALALGRVRHATARDALHAASKDPDPVVRSAVARALREERP